jgi:hypothetical protein
LGVFGLEEVVVVRNSPRRLLALGLGLVLLLQLPEKGSQTLPELFRRKMMLATKIKVKAQLFSIGPLLSIRSSPAAQIRLKSGS